MNAEQLNRCEILLELIAASLAKNSSEVTVVSTVGIDRILLEIVCSEEIGSFIGPRGDTIRGIRAVMRALARKEKYRPPLIEVRRAISALELKH